MGLRPNGTVRTATVAVRRGAQRWRNSRRAQGIGYLCSPENAPQDRHIHPIADRLLQRADKEALLGQRGCVVWMTGLSGSGKNTIAIGLERRLHEQGIFTQVLDGDNVRTGISNNLGFSEADRTENIGASPKWRSCSPAAGGDDHAAS